MAEEAIAGRHAEAYNGPDARTAKKSFAEILTGREITGDVPIRKPTTYGNLPAIIFTEEEERTLAESFKFALIGKFSRGLPVFKEIHLALAKLGLRGSFTVGAMKPSYILINPTLEEGFARLWVKQEWFIAGRVMRLFKWSPTFTYSKESAIAPVWVNLPNLPPYLFTKGAMYSIASLLGNPIKIDEATANRTRPSIARVCVEIDLLQPTTSQIIIKSGLNVYQQKIFFEDITMFCNLCHHRGHPSTACFSNGQNVHPTKNINPSRISQITKQQLIIETEETTAEPLTQENTHFRAKDVIPENQSPLETENNGLETTKALPQKARKGKSLILPSPPLDVVDVAGSSNGACIQPPMSSQAILETGESSRQSRSNGVNLKNNLVLETVNSGTEELSAKELPILSKLTNPLQTSKVGELELAKETNFRASKISATMNQSTSRKGGRRKIQIDNPK